MKSVKETETKHVESILRANDNPNNFIKSWSQPRKSRRTNDNANDIGFVELPYFQGISEKIAVVLRRQHIKVAFKPIKTIASILRKPKDKVPTEDSITESYMKFHVDNVPRYILGTQHEF